MASFKCFGGCPFEWPFSKRLLSSDSFRTHFLLRIAFEVNPFEWFPFKGIHFGSWLRIAKQHRSNGLRSSATVGVLMNGKCDHSTYFPQIFFFKFFSDVLSLSSILIYVQPKRNCISKVHIERADWECILRVHIEGAARVVGKTAIFGMDQTDQVSHSNHANHTSQTYPAEWYECLPFESVFESNESEAIRNEPYEPPNGTFGARQFLLCHFGRLLAVTRHKANFDLNCQNFTS